MLSFKKHPWHGIHQGNDFPELLTAFIEIVPGDTLKYEIDKPSGFLKIDRPQQYSNYVPFLYGFIPRTYCMENIAALASKYSGKKVEKGDGDPLDICVITSYHIPHGNIILKAKPIGGLRLLDKGEADDKIIAVLHQDEIFGNLHNIEELNISILKKLEHYFLTYKNLPGEKNQCEIDNIYNKDIALEVIKSSCLDYNHHFGNK
jgi:inorganic pyrophosphatase